MALILNRLFRFMPSIDLWIISIPELKNYDVELPKCIIKTMNSKLGHCDILVWWKQQCGAVEYRGFAEICFTTNTYPKKELGQIPADIQTI